MFNVPATAEVVDGREREGSGQEKDFKKAA